ncbi:acyl-CoA synthetase [Streptomyces sp. B6B3]|uniref:acyl-CoA synthetase n=1 Tax=Streptomyces sp. B6B3 TaxID=3153570 RepID=UPI00325E9235
MSSLFPAFDRPTTHDRRPALRFTDREPLSYADLTAAAGRLAASLRGQRLVAVWATPTPETAVGVVAALLAGVPAVPLNPRSGEREAAHIVSDSAPTLLLAEPGAELPPAPAALPRRDITLRAPGPPPERLPEPAPESPALVVYTSGTTGPPKGAVLPRRAIAATVDALADAWRWTADDVLVHALPLFHVHGLILGALGPLRLGGAVHHLGRFTVDGVARGLGEGGGTMLFGVPTMYHRLAEALGPDPGPDPGDDRRLLADALAGARLLVSGSAALPLHDHRRIAEATGRGVIERYGMTETLMITAVRADDRPRAGTVGVPLRGVELRLVGEDGRETTPGDVGEIQVRGPNLFTGYLGRPEATEATFADDGWFRTGDMANRDPDGAVRIVGRRATDLIKSGGYKIGAGEIENALLEHPGVLEAAVTGEPDADLGERVVAWVVPADPDRPPAPRDLAGHVARQLAPHKSPRAVRYLDALPRNAMGKVVKQDLAHG